jgi:DNA transformation protein
MGELSKLPNISKVIEEKLNESGVETVARLQELGSKEAFVRIRLRDNTACVNMLCALEGAIQGIRWHQLADDKKQELKAFYKTL